MGRSVVQALTLLALFAGCSGADSARDAEPSRDDAESADGAPVDLDGGRDAGPPASDAGPARMVEVGTGEDHFIPLTEDQLVMFNRGPQGGSRFYGFHIWAGVRVRDMNPHGISVNFVVHTATSGLELAMSSYTLDLDPEPSGGAFVASGLREMLQDCCLAAGRQLLIRTDVTDADGKTGSDERRVIGSECPRGLPNPTIDPCQ